MADKGEARLVLPVCVVTSFYQSTKNANQYIEVSAGDLGQFKFVSDQVDLSRVPQLVPLRVDVSVKGNLYKGMQTIRILGGTLAPVSVNAG